MEAPTPEQVTGLKKLTELERAGKSHQFFELGYVQVFYTVVHLDRKPYPYAAISTVLPQEKRTKISRDDYEIAISDDVPIDLRNIWAWHELNAFAVHGHDTKDHYLSSEKRYLTSLDVTSKEYSDYLPMRINFYRGLIIHMRENMRLNAEKSRYDNQDIDGALDCLEFLSSMQEFQEGINKL